MIEFRPESVYGVDADGEIIIGGQRSSVMLSEDASVNELGDFGHRLPMVGMKPEDFVVFARIRSVDIEGGDKFPTAYLVAEYGQNESTVIQADLVMQYPETYATPEMADRILSISEEDLNDFSILALARDLKKIYRD